jgi:hypothetical protein
MEDLRVIVKEVIETPSILGSHSEMTILNLLKKYMVFT